MAQTIRAASIKSGEAMSQATLSSFEDMQRIRAQLKENRDSIKGRRYPRRQLRPGSRLFAKQLDIVLIGAPIAGILAALMQAGSDDPFQESSLDALGFFVLLIFPMAEALTLKIFGNTPGKALFGLAIRDSQGHRPRFGKLLSRSYLCWFYGLGMGLPFVSLITLYCSRRHLEAHGIAGWDSRTGLLLIPSEMSARREAITILGFVALPLAALVFVAVVAAVTAVGTSLDATFNSIATELEAPEQSDAETQYSLGLMYANGSGVPQNDAEAVKWYRLAAEQGLAEAQSNLGLMYSEGRGVPQDDAQAVNWWRKAAAQGLAVAQNNLGFMHAEGRGVPQDDAEAVEWYLKAVEQGDALAQVNLGDMYVDGRGVPQDDAEAVKWYRKAAEQGNTEAQIYLGFLYREGRGIRQDYVEAYKWSYLAASLTSGIYGKDAAILRDSLAAEMTPEQIAEARKRAQEWIGEAE